MKRVVCDYHKVLSLVDKIAKQIKEDGINLTKIVAINRGGSVPARYLAARLDIRRIYSIGIEFYDDQKMGKVPLIYQNLTDAFEDKDNVLIVDDIYESGNSMLVAEKRVRLNGAGTIRAATLHVKEKSRSCDGIIPMYFGEFVKKNEWITYPWEI